MCVETYERQRVKKNIYIQRIKIFFDLGRGARDDNPRATRVLMLSISRSASFYLASGRTRFAAENFGEGGALHAKFLYETITAGYNLDVISIGRSFALSEIGRSRATLLLRAIIAPTRFAAVSRNRTARLTPKHGGLPISLGDLRFSAGPFSCFDRVTETRKCCV